MHPITGLGVLILFVLYEEAMSLKDPIGLLLLIPYVLVLIRIASSLERDRQAQAKERKAQQEEERVKNNEKKKRQNYLRYLEYKDQEQRLIYFTAACEGCTVQVNKGLKTCKGCIHFTRGTNKELPNLSKKSTKSKKESKYE